MNNLTATMKLKFQILATILLCGTFDAAQAQFGRAGSPAGATPNAPSLGGANAELFGENSSFTATMDMQAGKTPAESGKISFDHGQYRFEVDMSKALGASAASMQAMGIDLSTLVIISRPDAKVIDMIYPGLNAYAETPMPDSGTTTNQPKMEITKLGTETIDGHPCVKNKVVETDGSGVAHESTVWNATDLKNFPLKIEQTEKGTTTTMSFKDVKLGKVDASVFNPPAGAKQYSDVASMMQQEVMARALRGRGQ